MNRKGKLTGDIVGIENKNAFLNGLEYAILHFKKMNEKLRGYKLCCIITRTLQPLTVLSGVRN